MSIMKDFNCVISVPMGGRIVDTNIISDMQFKRNAGYKSINVVSLQKTEDLLNFQN
jgi:hypothetical protein